MASIELRGVGKRFGNVEALRDISFTVADGEVAALLGPSGCGKSTTLFVLAGLYKPSSGEVLFDGEDVAGVHPKDRNVGLVFQSYALYPHMNVRDNIGFPLKVQGMSKDERARRVAEVAELAGLAELLDRRPNQLSGGQQQRVAAARAIVKKPRLLLMDEPLSNLDLELRGKMRRELKRVQRETGITTIIVTHDQEEAMSMADRIYVMEAGRIQQCGDHRELYERPANRFVAGFIGMPPMNFAGELAVTTLAGSRWLTSQGAPLIPLAEGGQLGARDDLSNHVVGVRAEHITLAPPDGPAAATVTDRVPEGRDTIITVALDGADLELHVIVASTIDIEVGQAVSLRIDENYLHLFDDQGQAVFHGSHGRTGGDGAWGPR